MLHNIVPGVMTRFRQDLEDCLEDLSTSELTPESFRGFVACLKSAVDRAGLEALTRTLSELDTAADQLVRQGELLRFKNHSPKEWMTPFGLATIPRRLFQADWGGPASVPLDEACGMVNRYMTPDVEEICAYAAAMLVPREVETLLGMILPQGPSATAIQRVIHDVGSFAEERHDVIEDEIQDRKPLTSHNDVAVVSVDGVTVPLREPAAKRGRKADRPGVRDSESSPTAWKEAGVATVSIYSVDKPEEERLDTRYFARMPESGMTTLLTRIGTTVAGLLDEHEVKELVLLCDGKRSLWSGLANIPSLADATEILDFYHVSEHLSKAAEAIFGKRKGQASKWHDKYRGVLLERSDGADATIRSLRYHRNKLSPGTERAEIVRRVIEYLRRNQDRIRYAEFRARGLPIGSGPVEAACKNLVAARLKRSGMRWSRRGGQEVLNLRAPLLSGRWANLWEAYLRERKILASAA